MDNRTIQRVYNKIVKPALVVAGTIAVLGLTCNEGAKIYKGAQHKDLNSGIVHKGDWVYDLVSHGFYIGSKDSPKNRYITTYGDYKSLKQRADSLPLVKSACISGMDDMQKTIDSLAARQVNDSNVARYAAADLKNVYAFYTVFAKDSSIINPMYRNLNGQMPILRQEYWNLNPAPKKAKTQARVAPVPKQDSMTDKLMRALEQVEAKKKADAAAKAKK